MATRGQWEEYKNHGRKWKFLGNLKVGAGKEITRKKKKRLSFWRQWGKQGWGAEQTSNSCLPHLSMGLNTVFVVSCTFLFYLECVLWAYVLFYNFTKLSSFSGCPSSGFFSCSLFSPTLKTDSAYCVGGWMGSMSPTQSRNSSQKAENALCKYSHSEEIRKVI